MDDLDEVRLAITEHWVRAWKRSTILPNTGNRAEELHPSSFPYCGLRHSLDFAQSDGDSATFEMSATMEFYVSVGTVAHLIFQKHMRLLPGGGKEVPVVLGDWTCPTCQYKNKFRPYHTCKKCKSPAIQGEVARLSGDEIHVSLGDRTTGHADDVIKYQGKYYVMDYKTSSVQAVNNYKRFNRQLPYKHNVKQIKTYAPLLEKKYGITISGWFLLYIARDTPNREYAIIGGLIDEEERPQLHADIERADSVFHTMRKILKKPVNNNTPVLKGDKERIKRFSNYLIENKLCRSKDYYDNEVKDPYDECPFTDVCFNGMMPKYASRVFLRVGSQTETETETQDED